MKTKSKVRVNIETAWYDRPYVGSHRVMLTIDELLKIVEEAKLAGATNFQINEGNLNGTYASMYFYRLQTDEEYNIEIQKNIEKIEIEIEKLKKNML